MLRNVTGALVVLVLAGVLIYMGAPKLAAYYHNQGVEHYSNGLYKEAASSLKRALIIKPSAMTHYCLANTYMVTKQDENAIDEYKKAIRIDPQYIDAYSGVSEAYTSRGLHQKALKWADEAVATAPANQQAKELSRNARDAYAVYCLNEGLLAVLSKDKQKAYTFLEKALEYNPDFVYAYYVLGYYNYKNNQMIEAEIKMKEAISLDPTYWQAYKLLGDIYFAKSKYTSAINWYKKALELNQGNAALCNDTGIALMHAERYKEALVYLNKALSFDPSNPHTRYNLASTYRDEGMPEEAISQYKELARAEPGYPNMHNNLAGIYRSQGRESDAVNEYYQEIQYAQQRLLIDPEDIHTLNALAIAYEGIKEHKRAEEIIKNAIRLAPSYRDAHLTFATIAESLGNNEEALSSLSKASTLSKEMDFINKDIARLNRIEAAARKEKIHLKNGRTIEGVVKERTKENIVLEVEVGSSKGRITLSRDNILAYGSEQDDVHQKTE